MTAATPPREPRKCDECGSYEHVPRYCQDCGWEWPRAALAQRPPAPEPVAWLSVVVTPAGTKLQRLGFTREEAEMANADAPMPLYAAPPAAPPEPAADADGLLVQLRLAEEDYTVAWGRGDLYGWAADLIEQQARELAEMTIRAECAEMVCRDKDADWVTENARAKSAEADLAAARACIAAADAWRKECDADGYPRVYPDTSCGGGQGGQMLTCRTPGLIAAFDAARAAIKGTK